MENINAPNEIDNMIIESILLMGEDVELNGVKLINYKLKDIYGKKIGIINYFYYTHLCLQPIDVYFSEETSIKEMIRFLNVFTDCKWEFYQKFKMYYTLGNDNKTENLVRWSKDELNYILNIFKDMYCIEQTKKESDRPELSDRYKKLLMKFEKEEAKIKQSKGCAITMSSIVESVTCKHPSINFLNIWEYTVYQLMSSYAKLNQIDNEDSTIHGVYSGTVDVKKVDFNKLHWGNKIIK